MNNFASPSFWKAYEKLPKRIQILADKKFKIVKENPRHPSLHQKKVGDYWSVRIGKRHRAVAVEVENDLLWFWIGTHSGYDKLLK